VTKIEINAGQWRHTKVFEGLAMIAATMSNDLWRMQERKFVSLENKELLEIVSGRSLLILTGVGTTITDLQIGCDVRRKIVVSFGMECHPTDGFSRISLMV
jgi:hypothetical protein